MEGTVALLRLLKRVGKKDSSRPVTGRDSELGEPGWGLTRTAMASGRGPLVLRFSLASSTVYSHSRPIAVKVLLVASLPLGLRMKLPVTWFFTAGQGKRDPQISVPLHRATSQTAPEASALPGDPSGHPVYLSLLPT